MKGALVGSASYRWLCVSGVRRAARGRLGRLDLPRPPRDPTRGNGVVGGAAAPWPGLRLRQTAAQICRKVRVVGVGVGLRAGIGSKALGSGASLRGDNRIRRFLAALACGRAGEKYLQTGEELNRWRRAAQYLEAGVKFKRREYDRLEPHSLLDVKFRNGAMEMPCIVIDESTASLFRNLIAFEQTCPEFGDDFTAYIVFLSQLVSMPEDVTQLAKREIIVHHLDSDLQVSDLFTMLSKDVVFDFNGTYYLKSLCQILEVHYQNRLNRWMAWLWTNHFRNPWLGLAAAGTIVVLVCTVLQTIYGILAYINPP
ncbi:hypothetical protein BRADI_5g23932v3 [Brachypodium distachyon]|uniref:Uncharacterized protein n=1 Tax=Brachypodium distachyon TaxID=15368 RepID=A0A2K2CIZ1_BRADI|nr:hypothetical protein BRADI_5g23932v3 [Brachypodium distachyon]